MTKTPEQLAEEYAKTIWDESELAPEDRAIERHVAIGKHSTKIGFLAGYQEAHKELSRHIQFLETQLSQANNTIMRLQAEK